MTTLKFCLICNNILHPREDRSNKVLMYACKWCHYQEPADNNVVYHLESHRSADQRTQLVQDVLSQPTLPRTRSIRCVFCQHGEVAFFQDKMPSETGISLVLVCCSCGRNWRP